MIPQHFITEWSQQAPWKSPAQVEQDLILSRAIVEIFQNPCLREALLFRGGTRRCTNFFPPTSPDIRKTWILYKRWQALWDPS